MKDTTDESKTNKAFDRLYGIVKTLRSPEGCPWDKEQTPYSLRHDLMEECFEAIDAITQNDIPHTREELGDLLFVALLIASIYEESGDFTMDQVFDEVSDKLVRRHPHVFAESQAKDFVDDKIDTPLKVLEQWDRIKENLEGRKAECVLDTIPQGFPPLLKSYKMLSKAAKKGFEWSSIGEVQGKVTEEWEEVLEAQKDVEDNPCCKNESSPQKLHLEEEIGDMFLSLVNYSRWCGIDPSIAVDRANRKFYNRYSYVEKSMKENDIAMDKAHLQNMMDFWKQAKN